MTDRYTELVKQAYEAQQAREGDGYVNLTTELTTADDRLASLALDRERIVAALEAMDDAVEAAKEALDAYFAGREDGEFALTRDHMHELDADEPTESEDALFEDAAPGFYQLRIDKHEELYEIEPLPTEEDEYASAKANGALS